MLYDNKRTFSITNMTLVMFRPYFRVAIRDHGFITSLLFFLKCAWTIFQETYMAKRKNFPHRKEARRNKALERQKKSSVIPVGVPPTKELIASIKTE